MSERTVEQAWRDAKPAIMALLDGKRIRAVASTGLTGSWMDRKEFQWQCLGDPAFTWEVERDPPRKQYVDITLEQLFELCRARELLLGPDGAKCFVWNSEEHYGTCGIKGINGRVMWIPLSELRKQYTYAATGLPVANEVESK